MQAFGVSLALLGAACLVAGLVGGAVKLANFELPALESRRVRVVLSLLGTVFFLFGVSVFLSSLGVPFGSTPAEGNPSAPNAEDDPTQHLDVETAFVGTLLGVGDVSDVAFSPDGKILATAGGNDHTVLLWNAANGEQIRILNGDCVADAVAFSTDGKLLAGACKLFDPATGEHIREMAGGYDLEFSPDGNFLAIANGYEPNGVRLYNPSTGELIRAVTTDYANSLAFSPDGTLLATTTGYLEKGVVLWKPATGQQVRTLSDGSDAVAFSPDGKYIATSGDGKVSLYNPTTGEHLRDIGAYYGITFSRDGTLLTVGEDKAVRLYDPATGNPIRTFTNVYANAATFSPDGKRIATVSPDNTVRVVDVSQDRQ